MSIQSPPPVGSPPVSTQHFLAPLSFAQQRLWFLAQLYPDSAAYNVPFGMEFVGHLDRSALLASLNHLIQRHETLRTTIREIDGEPHQVIHKSAPVVLTDVDLSSDPEPSNALLKMRVDESRTPFDLANGPLLRLSLVRISPEKHVLLVTMHHIISDGWSAGIFMRELADAYSDQANGRTFRNGDLPIQYADYAAWQREYFTGSELESPLSWWREALSGMPRLLDLPTEFPRPKHQTFAGATVARVLAPELRKRIDSYCREAMITPFMFITAAFNLLLHRYTRQTDIALGTPVANRDRVELEPLIGFVANTVVLRMNLAGDPTFKQLVERARDMMLAAFEHQQLPFDKLVEELHPARDLAHNPIFQVMIGSYARAAAPLELPELKLNPLDPYVSTAKFDLSLFFVEGSASDELLLEYNTDLFSERFADRLLGHLLQISAHGLTAPDTPISRVPMLEAGEQELILRKWNATEAPLPEITLVDLLNAQASRTPLYPALRFQNETISYAELHERANQLAHHLIGLGVVADTLVAVSMERSIDMIVALVAVLKAGGAYVPIDPFYPQDRLDFILSDAETPILLTQSHLKERFSRRIGQLIAIDAIDLRALPKGEPAASIAPDNLAYCIYTSGSTGKPKGALNLHRGICNRLLWGQNAYGIRSEDRVLQKTPFSFDVSVWEIFWPLITGATLVIAKPEGHKDPVYLAELIQQEKITTVHFVPSMLQVFVNEPDASKCTSIRRVICSGEALPFELQQRFFERFSAQLLNYYGPTETSVEVTFWECDSKSTMPFVPIGRPVANTQIYILNEQMQPQPALVPGELFIGGVPVARGYHKRPELTDQKFVADPFSRVPNSKLYRTGDLARFLPDGTIQYLGRIDFQVKIRGFRIELEEIESVIRHHPLVREAVVIAAEINGQQQLVAYYVPYPAVRIEKDSLRAHLREHLPEYMIPGAFIELRALPLNANGKVDRKSLPPPQSSSSSSSSEPPRTQVEKTLARIWCDVLRIETVGVHDNFFELGGHSLLATQLIARIRASFQTQIPLSRFFEKPTIAEIGCELAEDQTRTRPDAMSTKRLPNLTDDQVDQLLRTHLPVH